MWVFFVAAALAAVGAQDQYAFRFGRSYKYRVEAVSVSGLNQVKDQYAGIVLRGVLEVQCVTDSIIEIKPNNFSYAEFNDQLPGGWMEPIPTDLLNFKKFDFKVKSFNIEYMMGVIRKTHFVNGTSLWEMNVMRSFASQFQLDTRGSFIIDGEPPPQNYPYGSYTTMEDTVTGMCATDYTVVPLPRYIALRQQDVGYPENWDLPYNSTLIDVVKAVNFTNCEARPDVAFGLNGQMFWESPQANEGVAYGISSTSRAVLSGEMSHFTIQSTNSKHSVVVSPLLWNQQKGVLGSRLTTVLLSVDNNLDPPMGIISPVTYDTLLYVPSGNTDPISDVKVAQVGKPSDVVVQIARHVAEKLQYPGEIVSNNALHDFLMLSEFTRIFDSSDMVEIGETLYADFPKDVDNPQQATKYAAWVVYVEALAQTGVGESLSAIQTLIEKKYLNGSLGARALGLIARTARTPSRAFVHKYFNLVTSEAVQSCKVLFSTGLLAFSNLVYSAQVNPNDKYDPLIFFRRVVVPDFTDVEGIYLPFLKKGLDTAISKGDYISSQLYVRAIGNVGYSQGLQIFQPYLLFERNATDFERLQMVMAMDRIVRTDPKAVGPVLFKLFRNITETDAIRSAAVMLFVESKPSATYLKNIAQLSNSEKNKQVLAAMVTALKSAASLRGSLHGDLAKNSQQAVNLLSSNETGLHESGLHWWNSVVDTFNLQYDQTIRVLGSRDSLFPKSLSFNLHKIIGGFKHQQREAEASVSSIGDLMNRLELLTEEKGKPKYSDTLWSIVAQLGIVPPVRQRIQGNVRTNINSVPSYYAFDEDTVARIPEMIRNISRRLKSGEQFQKTMISNTATLKFSFPNIIGFPSNIVYLYQSLCSFKGKIHATTVPDLAEGSGINFKKPTIIKSTITFNFTASKVLSTSVSSAFVYTGNVYESGREYKSLYQLPAKVDIGAYSENSTFMMRVEPTGGKKRLVQVVDIPYTRVTGAAVLEPVNTDPNAKIIHVREPKQVKGVFGRKTTGMAFLLDNIHERQFTDRYWLGQKLEKMPDILSVFHFCLPQSEIYYRNMSIWHLPEESTAFAVELKTYYAEVDSSNKKAPEKKKNTSELKGMLEAVDQSRTLENVVSIAPRVMSVYNVSLVFDGPRRGVFWASIIRSFAPVDPNSVILWRSSWWPADAAKPDDTCLDIIRHVPLLPKMSNIPIDPASTLSVNLQTGARCKGGLTLNGEIKLFRTDDRLKFIEECPITRLCNEQQVKMNRILPACRIITLGAPLLNHVSLNVNYTNVQPTTMNRTYFMYSELRHLLSPYVTENVVNTSGAQNLLKIWSTASPNLRSLNVSISTHKIDANFTNIRLNRWVAALLIPNPALNTVEQIANMATRSMYNASCAVDDNKINTFDNRTYDASIGNCWHALLVPTRKSDSTAVLVKDADPEQRVLKILKDDDEVVIERFLGKSAGDAMSATYIPIVVRINNEGHLVKSGDIVHLAGKSGRKLLKAYSQIDSLRVEFSDLIVEFDGRRARLQAHHSFKSSVRGLCGNYDGEPINDFETPAGRPVDDVGEFVSSYSLGGTECSGPGRSGNAETRNEQYEYCTKKHTLVKQLSATTYCLSVEPQTVCEKTCKARGQRTTNAFFYCLRMSEPWMKMVKEAREGHVFNFSDKKTNLVTSALRLPETCVKK